MAILKNSWLRVGVAVLLSVFGFLVLVNAMESEKKVTKAVQTELVYFQFDGSGQPIPIPEENLEENTHEPESNPFNCPNSNGPVCSAAYSMSDLEQDASGNWQPSSSATPSEVRRYTN